jgi:hypothetical protein
MVQPMIASFRVNVKICYALIIDSADIQQYSIDKFMQEEPAIIKDILEGTLLTWDAKVALNQTVQNMATLVHLPKSLTSCNPRKYHVCACNKATKL